MKILIITHDFPPINRCASWRPFSWAKYWNKLGHEICVLTACPNSLNAPVNIYQDDNISKDIRIEQIKYVSNKFSKKSQAKNSQNIQQLRFTSEIKKIVREFSEFIGGGSLFFASILWIYPSIKKAEKIHQNWQFDIVVSTFGPPAAHIIAGVLKKKFDFLWVADYRDLWFGGHLYKAKFPFSIIEKLLENYFVSHADLLTTVSQPLAKKLESLFDIKTITIENGFDPEFQLVIENNIFPQDNKIRLAYTGVIQFGNRDTEPIFKALDLIRNKKIDINQLEILFYTDNPEALKKIIEKYQLENIVKNLNYVPRDKVLQIQQAVDALIFLDWNNVEAKGILTGKLFEYMYSGTPILSIGGNSQTSANQLMKKAGVGIILENSIAKIAAILEKLIQKEKLEYSPSPEVLKQYTREHLAKKMLNTITDLYLNSSILETNK